MAIPAWLQILQALLTPTIAVVVGVIAFLQWRTAHQKVVLDLFDRRLRIYEAVASGFEILFGGITTETSWPAREKLYRAETEARFLFGPEVSEAILSYAEDMATLSHLIRTKDKSDLTPENHREVIGEIVVCEDRLNKWPQRMSKLCEPYMKMDQNLIPSPADWLRERNKIRNSYGDKP